MYCKRCSITLWQFAKRAQIIILELLQKVICYPLDYFACGINKLNATQIMFVIPMREQKLEYKNGGEIWPLLLKMAQSHPSYRHLAKPE